MAERPILFSAPMVRAILDGRKKMTRRVIKPAPGPRADEFDSETMNAAWQEGWIDVKCPYGKVGDRLWVREAFSTGGLAPNEAYYRASAFDRDWYDFTPDEVAEIRWKPSIHMPRWASRITLEITDVRVERLNDISKDDIYAEGAITDEWLEWREDAVNIGMPPGSSIMNEHDVWERLWDSINGLKFPWASNPWVWIVEFKRVEQPND
ncbi:MAG: hypothetical protein QM647_13115 [Asticcacaulis sp.]|uniref:hypothetical protein n=1 Tax=Asticcacaulis sp. TaxID=1872648 RepID=UPI0039E2E57A